MKKFIPYEKLSKKQKKAADAAKRKSWDGVNPVTRVSQNEKVYNRARARRRYYDSDAGSFLCRGEKGLDKTQFRCIIINVWKYGLVLKSCCLFKEHKYCRQE